MADAEAGDAAAEDACFVCLEEGGTIAHCACNLRAHPACLLRAMRASAAPSCTVCKRDYARAATRRGVVLRCNAILPLSCLAAAVVSAMLFLLVLHPMTPGVASGMAVGILLVLVGVILGLQTAHRCVRIATEPVSWRVTLANGHVLALDEPRPCVALDGGDVGVRLVTWALRGGGSDGP